MDNYIFLVWWKPVYRALNTLVEIKYTNYITAKFKKNTNSKTYKSIYFSGFINISMVYHLDTFSTEALLGGSFSIKLYIL